MRTLPTWEARMGVCETNSLEDSGPSPHPILRRPSPASRSLLQPRAPPCPDSSHPTAPHEKANSCTLDRPDLMGAMGHARVPRVVRLLHQASSSNRAGAGSRGWTSPVPDTPAGQSFSGSHPQPPVPARDHHRTEGSLTAAPISGLSAAIWRPRWARFRQRCEPAWNAQCRNDPLAPWSLRPAPPQQTATPGRP